MNDAHLLVVRFFLEFGDGGCLKLRSMSSGFGSGMVGTYLSMANTYTGAGSGAGAVFGAGDSLVAARAVVDVCGGPFFCCRWDSTDISRGFTYLCFCLNVV